MKLKYLIEDKEIYIDSPDSEEYFTGDDISS